MVISTKSRVVGIALAAAAALVLGGCSDSPDSSASDPVPSGTRTEAAWVIDVNDQRQLAGFADAVFVGTVMEKTGTTTDRIAVPETQFTVKVLETLKGELAEQITVNQQGGTDPKTGETTLLEEDPLIEAGKTYLFATRYNSTLNFYTVVPVSGHQELSAADVEKLNQPNARGAQPSDPEAVNRMRDSIANEVPYEEPQPHISAPTGPAVAPMPQKPTETPVAPEDPQISAPPATSSIAPSPSVTAEQSPVPESSATPTSTSSVVPSTTR